MALARAEDDLDWSSWIPLKGARRNPLVQRAPGLYRIRSVETGRILYVGQTGRTLKERLGELRGVYGDEMPYNDPHTVGPALWAHRIDTGETFEVSVAVLEVDKADRLGREALEVTKQRVIDGCSPAYNFGRMPFGWWPSRGSNTKANKAAGKYVRGRRMTDDEISALPPDESVPPPSTLEGDTRAADWLGLAWRDTDVAPPKRGDVGVYRIATRPHGPLDYLGQGLIVSRWKSHADGWVTDLAAEQTDATAWSWVPLDLGARQLLEVENDLIASHMVIFAQPPVAQFGRSR